MEKIIKYMTIEDCNLYTENPYITGYLASLAFGCIIAYSVYNTQKNRKTIKYPFREDDEYKKLYDIHERLLKDCSENTRQTLKEIITISERIINNWIVNWYTERSLPTKLEYMHITEVEIVKYTLWVDCREILTEPDPFIEEEGYKELAEKVSKAKKNWEKAEQIKHPDVRSLEEAYQTSKKILNNWIVAWYNRNQDVKRNTKYEDALEIICSKEEILNYKYYISQPIITEPTLWKYTMIFCEEFFDWITQKWW